jgi:chromosome segregation ATPase
MTTIQRALKEWWFKIGDHLEALEYLQGFPPEVLSPLLQVFEQIRTVAHEQAYAEYEEAVDEAREAIDSANAERETAQQTLEIAQDEIKSLHRQVDQLVERGDGLERQVHSETDRRQAIQRLIEEFKYVCNS